MITEQQMRITWVLYDFTVNYTPRLDTFRKLVALGISRRNAVEMIHSYERETM